MEMINRKFRLLIVAIILVTLMYSSSAAENNTIQNRTLAIKCVDDSLITMNQLAKDGFNTLRINDTLKTTIDLLNTQLEREKRNQGVDYTKIIDSCNNIERIKSLAYQAKDEIFVLNKEYLEFKTKSKDYSIDTSEVDILMKNLNQSIDDERYENVIEQIPIISNKMTEIESSATAFKLYYKTASRGVRQIIQDNLIILIIIFVLLIASLIVYKFYLKRKIIEKKIRKLEIEKKALQEMIKKIQREYFEENKMAEGEYNIRTKKFAELIRDIERQIPLYKEQLAMMGHYVSQTDKFEKNIYRQKK